MNRQHTYASPTSVVAATSEQQVFSMVHPTPGSPYPSSHSKTKSPLFHEAEDVPFDAKKHANRKTEKCHNKSLFPERTKLHPNKILNALRGGNNNNKKQSKNKRIGPSPPNTLQHLQKEREQANLVIWRMKGKILRLEAELEDCREQLERKKEVCVQQDRSLEYLMTEVIPSLEEKQQQLSPNGPLSPVRESLVESTFRVGNYDIGRFLGDGYYAKVYLGTHRDTRQKYAIKMLCKRKLRQLHQLSQLELELQVLKTVSHPNIVQLEDVMHAPKQVYLVMNLGYKDLYSYSRHHGLTMRSVQQVLVGVFQPLEYLHKLGICHLDLKPENILVKELVENPHELRSCHIQLCDFGLCAVNTSWSSPNHVPVMGVSGTPGFFAPELVLSRYARLECNGCAADMWSVGCILLELAEGLPEGWLDAYGCYKEDVVDFEMRVKRKLRLVQKSKYFCHSQIHDLVNRLVVWNPKDRLIASRALQHEWLQDMDESCGVEGMDKTKYSM